MRANSPRWLSKDETAQVMVEYLLIVSLVVLTIMAAFSVLVHMFFAG